MKIKIAVEARVSKDRKRCLESCPGIVGYFGNPLVETAHCRRYCRALNRDHLGRPLRCRACIRNEVRP